MKASFVVRPLFVKASARAFAQEAAPSPDPAEEVIGADEIVVTAQKRTERLQDVPLAVTAISADTLVSRHINESSNLAVAVPSLSFQQGNNPANTTIAKLDEHRVGGTLLRLVEQDVWPIAA